MSRYDELKKVRRLSNRSDTNSIIDLVQDEQTGNLYVRKVIYGVDQPLYQGIFSREVQALYRLNSCDNIVKIVSHSNMLATNATTQNKEKVGCIFFGVY